MVNLVDYQQSTEHRTKTESRISSFLSITRAPMTYPPRLLPACIFDRELIGC